MGRLFFRKNKNIMRANPLSIIKKRPTLFRSLTGLPYDKFTELLEQIEPLYEQSEAKRLYKDKRERKQGGGRQKQLYIASQKPDST